MTTDEKERLEIVKEVCSLQDCTLQEIYNFVKTGKVVTGPLPKTANNPEPAALADGVYIVTKDGSQQVNAQITDVRISKAGGHKREYTFICKPIIR